MRGNCLTNVSLCEAGSRIVPTNTSSDEEYIPKGQIGKGIQPRRIKGKDPLKND